MRFERKYQIDKSKQSELKIFLISKKPNQKFLEVSHTIGFILLISIVLFANGNDVYRFLFN